MYLFNRPFFIHTPLSLIWWERVTQAKKIPLDPICSNIIKQFQSDCDRAVATKFQSQNQILAPNAHCSQQNLWFQMKISLSNKIQTMMPFYMEPKKGKGGIETFPFWSLKSENPKGSSGPAWVTSRILFTEQCSGPANDRNKDFHVKTSRYPTIHSSLEPIYSIND